MNVFGSSQARGLGACVAGMLLAVVLAVATQTTGYAQAADDIVGPGESIQQAINRADPGDTIVVRGVHREDVVIRKNAEIARRLFLSPKTVRNHISHIFTKLQIADRTQAILRAREAGLGQDDAR